MLVVIALVLVLFLCVKFLYQLNYPDIYNVVEKIPGPKTVPFFGNTLDFSQDQSETTKIFLNWYETYGSPMRVKIGPRYAIHLFKPQHVELILKNMDNITKSTDYDYVGDWLGRGLLTSAGSKWHTTRKLLTPTFHYNILLDFVPIMNENSKILLDMLFEHVEETIDIAPFLTRCTMDILCETAMGFKVNAQKGTSPYIEAVKEFATLISHRTRRPWLYPNWIFYSLPQGRRYAQCLKILHSFTNEVIHQREDNAPSEGKKRLAFLDLLLELKKEGKMNKDNVREEVDTFMFEGHDTTATGLMWAVWCIASHEQCQQDVYEEITQQSDGDINTPVTASMASELKLLDRVLKESQRLFPSVPIIARRITNPFTVDNKIIPKGATLNIPIIQLHRNAESFPDPLKFDPDRFLPENVEKRHPFAFAPFAAGPRNCIGQKFALLEEKIVLVHLIRSFKFTAVEKFEDMKPSMTMVLKPLNGVWVKIQKRN